MLACDAAPGHLNHAWQFETNAPAKFEQGTVCPPGTGYTGIIGKPGSGAYTGLFARTVLLGPMPISREYAQWTVRAPTGTRITSLDVWRWLGKEGGSGYVVYGRQADGSLLAYLNDPANGETCEVPAGQDECNLGGPQTSYLRLPADTTSVSYGFECPNSRSSCSTGSTIHSARAAVYGARVTITDPAAPAIGETGGPLVTQSGYLTGTQTATVSASDATGIREVRAYLNGVRTGTTSLPCDFTHTRPCMDASAASVSIDTSQLPDGTYALEFAAVDAAGNETRTPARALRLDNDAPGAADLHQSGDGRTPRPIVSWTPPADHGAPIIAVWQRLCTSGPWGSGTCQPDQRTLLAPGQTELGIELPAPGTWTAFLRLEDALGHTSWESRRGISLTYWPPSPPSAPSSPNAPTSAPSTPPPSREEPTARPTSALRITRARRTGRTLHVAGTVTASTTGRVRISFAARIGRQTVRARARSTVRSGAWRASVRLPATLARAQRGSLVVRFVAPDGRSVTARRAVA